MDKLKLIIKREFLSKVKNRTFIIMTFVSPLLMLGMIFLIGYLSKSSMEKINEVAYVNNSRLFTGKDFKDTQTIHFTNLSEVDLEQAKEIINNSEQDGLLFIPSLDSIDALADKIQFFSKETPSMVLIADLERMIEKKLETEKMQQLGIDLEKLKRSKLNVDIKLSNFVGERSSKLINGIKIGLGMGAGYIIMMFIIIYGAMVMRSVIEEKTSRIIEVIISSVKPFQLMMGKVLGTAAAGLLQFLIWVFIMAIILFVGSYFLGVDTMQQVQSGQVEQAISQTDAQFAMTEVLKLPFLSFLTWFILFFLGGYFLYSSIYAAIGSAVDNETDTQQFMFPVLMPLMIGVYVGFATVINDPHGTVATVFSMIPFTSPIVMLMRIPFGVPLWQILLSLFLLIITFIFVIWIAAKIYRVGILMYGKKVTYKELYKWLKY